MSFTAEKDTSFIQSDVYVPAPETRIRKLKGLFSRLDRSSERKSPMSSKLFNDDNKAGTNESTLYQPRVKETLQ